MTIKFNKKVAESNTKSLLESITEDQFNDAKFMKNLSKKIITGKEVELTCCLASNDSNFGRSLVFDLN